MLENDWKLKHQDKHNYTKAKNQVKEKQNIKTAYNLINPVRCVLQLRLTNLFTRPRLHWDNEKYYTLTCKRYASCLPKPSQNWQEWEDQEPDEEEVVEKEA